MRIAIEIQNDGCIFESNNNTTLNQWKECLNVYNSLHYHLNYLALGKCEKCMILSNHLALDDLVINDAEIYHDESSWSRI